MTMLEQINKMSDEQIADLNRELSNKLVKRIAITIGVTVVAHVAIALLDKKISKKN